MDRWNILTPTLICQVNQNNEHYITLNQVATSYRVHCFDLNHYMLNIQLYLTYSNRGNLNPGILKHPPELKPYRKIINSDLSFIFRSKILSSSLETSLVDFVVG